MAALEGRKYLPYLSPIQSDFDEEGITTEMIHNGGSSIRGMLLLYAFFEKRDIQFVIHMDLVNGKGKGCKSR